MFFPYRKRRLGGGNGLLATAALFFGCAIVSSLWARAAHADDSITQRVAGLSVSEVEVRGSVEVEISQGEPAELLLRGPTGDLEKTPFIFRGGRLIVGDSASYPRISFKDVRYKLTLPSLESLTVAGSGNVYVKPMVLEDLSVLVDGSGDIRLFGIEADDLRLVVEGSGDIDIVTLRVKNLAAVLAGSGDIRMGSVQVRDDMEVVIKGSGDVVAKEEGTAGDMEIAIIGSGDADLRQINSDGVDVAIVGSGNVRINNVQSLDVTVLGSGDVYYSGDPDINTTVLGSGELHKTDD